MHTNPFSSVGYDLQDIRNELHRKADQHEIHSLRGSADRLEHSLRDTRADIDGLRSRCEQLEENYRALLDLHEQTLAILREPTP